MELEDGLERKVVHIESVKEYFLNLFADNNIIIIIRDASQKARLTSRETFIYRILVEASEFKNLYFMRKGVSREEISKANLCLEKNGCKVYGIAKGIVYPISVIACSKNLVYPQFPSYIYIIPIKNRPFLNIITASSYINWIRISLWRIRAY